MDLTIIRTILYDTTKSAYSTTDCSCQGRILIKPSRWIIPIKNNRLNAGDLSVDGSDVDAVNVPNAISPTHLQEESHPLDIATSKRPSYLKPP